LIALTLNKNFTGVKIATNWIILSFIIPTVVIVVIWKLMLSSSSGIVNSLLIQFHIIEKPIGFFSSSTSAFISLVLINSWRWSPFLALIILSGLKSINQEIYDASKIDGTSFFSEFFFITLPQLKGVLFVLGLVGTLLSFNVFDIIWLITKGGPSSATTTLPLLIYETAFTKFRISQAAALSVITSFILLTFSIVFIKVMGRDNDDE
jgi:multiple sugar transport system permease protein